MRTETKIITLYKFNELPDDIQEKVISSYRENDEYFSHEDNESVLRKFCNIFPVVVKNYNYGGYKTDIDFYTNVYDQYLEMSPFRLRTYLINNFYNYLFTPKYLGYRKGKAVYSKISLSCDCPLTGYSLDMDILSPILDFIKNPDNRDFPELLSDCLYSWLYACEKDFDYWLSEECIREEIEANGYEFLSDGTIY